MDRVVQFLKHQHRVWLYLEAIGLIFAIAFVDYVTGYEVTIYPFYAVSNRSIIRHSVHLSDI